MVSDRVWATGLLAVLLAAVERVLDRRPLTARQEDTVDLTTCRYRGKGVTVRVTVDSASQAARRYFNALTERQQFYGDQPKLRPHDVKGVGEDEALGGVAAYWVPSTGRLAAYGFERIVKVDLGVRGLSDAASRRAAARIGRIAFSKNRRTHD